MPLIYKRFTDKTAEEWDKSTKCVVSSLEYNAYWSDIYSRYNF